MPGPPTFLEHAAQRVAGEYPFHGVLLSHIALRPTDQTARAALTFTSNSLEIAYNPDFVAKLNVNACAGLLLHMLNHAILGHVMMREEDFPNENALLIAQECTANEWLPEELRPPGALLPAEHGLPPGEDAVARYGRLDMRTPPECHHALCYHGVGSAGEHPSGAKRKKSATTHANRPQVAAVIVRGILRDAYARLGINEREELDAPTRKALEAALPGAFAGQGAEEIKPAAKGRKNWRKILRRFVMRELVQEYTTSRPSRRLPHLVGIVPGRYSVPNKLKTLMIAIDTSASMTTALLKMIFGELRPLARFAELIVVQCDASIHSIEPFNGKIPKAFGRGGTSFCPPFERALIRRLDVDGVIYFTDGQGMAPRRAPSVPVLWCLTPGGQRPARWGRTVWLPDPGADPEAPRPA